MNFFQSISKLIREYKRAEKTLNSYQQNAQQLQQEHDFNQFQFDELEKAALREGEQEELEERFKST